MAFTPRTETYVNVSSLTTPFNITVTKPTGTVDGDILFVWIGWYAAVTIDSVPSGWNLAGQYIANTDRYALYYKVASGEGASWVWSFTATAKVRAVCSCYTAGDFDSTTPIDVISNTAYRTSDTSVRAASMTATAANSPLIFWAGVYYTSSATFTKPTIPTSGWVENDDAGSTTPDFWTEVCSFIWSGSGATGVMAATCTITLTAKHAFAVALKPKVYEVGTATLSGLGTLAGVGVRTRRGLAALSGVGIVTTIGNRTRCGIATLNGVGLLFGIPKRIRYGIATLVGVGSLSSVWTRVRTAIVSLDGVGSISAIGTVILGTIYEYGSALLSGVGSLVATGVMTLSGTSTLVGSGTLSTTYTRIRRGIAQLEGLGLISAIGTVTGVVYEFGSILLTGIGTLVGKAAMAFASRAILAGVGSISVIGKKKLVAPPGREVASYEPTTSVELWW